jgi:hypothetical protein
VPRRTAADPVARAFGANLRAARKAEERGSTTSPARVPRLGPRYLDEIELGWHASTIVTCKRLADALKTPLHELVRGL